MNNLMYMELALQLANSAKGQTSSNPVVGCVIVKDGEIVGLGSHLRRGEAHAEVHALNMAGQRARGATAYVTLEPCSHYGRTPPCAKRLVDAGIQKVIIATLDPNPRVSGNGVKLLKEHHVDVSVGLCGEQAERLNETFNKYIVSKQPFVTLKTAATLDGKIASFTGDSRWITGAKSREKVHQLRHQHEAIMVGIGTVHADNPSLTTRLDVPALQPLRVIIDSKLTISEEANIVQEQTSNPTLIFTTDHADEAKKERLQSKGVQIISTGSTTQVNLSKAMQELGQREISSVLLEGGGKLNGAMLSAKLIDKMVLFYGPLIVGGSGAPANFEFSGVAKMNEAIKLKIVELQQFDEDICIIGYPQYETGGI